MHICIDENSRYDENHVEWHYFKKTIIGKKPNVERNNWLIDEKILISFKLIYIWMKILNEISCTLNLISIKFN